MDGAVNQLKRGANYNSRLSRNTLLIGRENFTIMRSATSKFTRAELNTLLLYFSQLLHDVIHV